jgi:hypothetical protein
VDEGLGLSSVRIHREFYRGVTSTPALRSGTRYITASSVGRNLPWSERRLRLLARTWRTANGLDPYTKRYGGSGVVEGVWWCIVWES